MRLIGCQLACSEGVTLLWAQCLPPSASCISDIHHPPHFTHRNLNFPTRFSSSRCSEQLHSMRFVDWSPEKQCLKMKVWDRKWPLTGATHWTRPEVLRSRREAALSNKDTKTRYLLVAALWLYDKASHEGKERWEIFVKMTVSKLPLSHSVLMPTKQHQEHNHS